MAHELYHLLTFLDEEALLYRLDRLPPDGVTITVALSGERLEINIHEDGKVDFLRFTGGENAGDTSPAVAKLYTRLTRGGDGLTL